MKTMKLGTILGTAVVASTLILPAGAASAAETPGFDDLTPEQKQAVAAWEATPAPTGLTVAPTSTNPVNGLQATSSRRTSLYRGSWLMWANERVDFNFNGSHVSWSSGFQESGAIFPNNVTQRGTSRAMTSTSQHYWRGSYTVGAGVPTPWGNANVYNATSTAHTRVYNTGAWSASWTG